MSSAFFWVDWWLFLLFENQIDYNQNNECTDSANDDVVQPFPVAFEQFQAKVANIKQPAAEEAANNADNEVNHEPHAITFEKQAALPAGQSADYNQSDDFGRWHFKIILVRHKVANDVKVVFLTELYNPIFEFVAARNNKGPNKCLSLWYL